MGYSINDAETTDLPPGKANKAGLRLHALHQHNPDGSKI